MVQCIEVRQVTLPVHQCRSYEQLLASAAEQCGRSLFTLKLFFVSSNGQATLIESDSDLLSLRYIARGSSYSFRVEISKSRAEVEREEQAAAIEEYLEATYEDIAEQALQQQLRQISVDYLQELYGEVARAEEQETLRMEREEVKKCLLKINQKAIQSHLSRASLPKSRPAHRESLVERTVERVLREMMPVMVKQLSSRIMEELRRYNKFEDSNRDAEENPQEL